MTVELLIDCGWEEKAKWFSELKNSIENAAQGSKEFNRYLSELDNALSGMGSLSDLPLRDSTQKKSEQDIRNLQWELVEQLGDAIVEIKITSLD